MERSEAFCEMHFGKGWKNDQMDHAWWKCFYVEKEEAENSCVLISMWESIRVLIFKLNVLLLYEEWSTVLVHL